MEMRGFIFNWSLKFVGLGTMILASHYNSLLLAYFAGVLMGLGCFKESK